MSRSSTQADQTDNRYAAHGFTATVRSFFADLASSDPVANAIYAENTQIRESGRNWLM